MGICWYEPNTRAKLVALWQSNSLNSMGRGWKKGAARHEI